MDLFFSGQKLSGLELIETFRRQADGSFRDLPLHLERLQRSAARLGWPCDLRAVQAALNGLVAGPGDLRVRLTLDGAGRIGLQTADLPPNPASWRLGIASVRLDSADPWLSIKSTRRAVYDQARKELPAGIDELVFQNERDELCEGTITNLFIRREGRLLTPPLRAGLLPGILRRRLLDAGEATEAVLFTQDLQGAEAVFVGNSLRGLIPAKLVLPSDGPSDGMPADKVAP